MSEPGMRCLVADDHPALLHAVGRHLSEHGFEIVASAGDGEGAVAAAKRERPDLAVVDCRMPRCGEAELVERLTAASPGMQVAVYTGDADEALAERVLAAGASAIVLKEAPLADLVRALTSIRAGRPYVDAAIGARALAPSPGTGSLTPREIQVLYLLAEGLSHDQVGERLEISGETARTHLRKACDRLGAGTRTEAVARAIRMGLV